MRNEIESLEYDFFDLKIIEEIARKAVKKEHRDFHKGFLEGLLFAHIKEKTRKELLQEKKLFLKIKELR